MRYYLGLDCSTSRLGYALLSAKDGEVVTIGSIDLKECETISEKISRVVSFLDGFVIWEQTAVGIEAPLAGFKNGFTTAQTIAKLQQIAGALCYAVFTKTEREPSLIAARSARATLGIKSSGGRDKAKEAAIAYATAAGVKFETKAVLKGKMAGTVCWIAGTDDAADAFVIARSLLLQAG